MTEPQMKLYAFWRSMAAYRVRVALGLKGIQAQEIPINLDTGEQFAPDFLAVNPEGAVAGPDRAGAPADHAVERHSGISGRALSRPAAAAEGAACPGTGAIPGGADHQRYASLDRAARP
ncbi:MAG: hypothetical protein WDN69_37770 [Aliidongia sp.]